ncbi:MAG: hypothetical protein OQL19_12355 [Gammaproteobacteria bacterium]|nr:hypothetical protein [Gammaproteobacteria bacterium]
MKHITLFCTLLILQACSINTKFDDGDYRPVGASTPVNSKTYTISETTRSDNSISESSEGSIDSKNDIEHDSNSTRYVKPGSDNNLSLNNKNTSSNIDSSSNQDDPKKENLIKPSKTADTNIITTSLTEIFSSRYGNSDIIYKISKTVKIHCEQENNSHSNLTICEYQFPQHCGSHSFSLISSDKNQLLMFHDKGFQRNIIDTLKGNTDSKAGLWDNDDYVSSELLSVNQVLNKRTTNSNSLGWIMNVSDSEKAQLGRSYISAIKDASKCF